jgi:hypothetical protein
MANSYGAFLCHGDTPGTIRMAPLRRTAPFGPLRVWKLRPGNRNLLEAFGLDPVDSYRFFFGCEKIGIHNY